MNGAALLLEGHRPDARALVALDAAGRRELSFGEVTAMAHAVAAQLADAGVGPGDVVVTLQGSRPEWVASMLAGLHVGAAVLPCIEQLRPRDLASRLSLVRPKAILSLARNRELVRAALAEQQEPQGEAPSAERPIVLELETAVLLDAAGSAPVPPAAQLSPTDPAILTFTSGTSGPPKAVVHGLKYLEGQRVQAEHWFGAQPGELAWCTATPGWSKSARNVFIAPWLGGAAALLHDARFDPAERVRVLAREQPQVLCMAPTEYRLLAKRADLGQLPQSLRRLVAAGEALDPAVLSAWHEATGVWVRDGFGQTETGQLTAPPSEEDPVPGSMGRPLPGFALSVEFSSEAAGEGGAERVGELVIDDPSTVPTFFVGYLDPESGRAVPTERPWRTGDRVRQDAAGNLFFAGRSDDMIISSGYRIGPFEVESVLVEHASVAEAAVVAAPDPERGSVVRAVVVLRDEVQQTQALKAELQAYVQARTAPYKYPRIVDFVDELPKTASGKVRRTALRPPTIVE